MRAAWSAHSGGRGWSSVAALGVGLTLLVAGPASAAAPPPPADLRVTPSGPTRDTSIVATWTMPDDAPAGTTARWRTTATAPGTGLVTEQEGTSVTPGRAEIPTPAEGRYSVVAVALVSPTDEEGPAATVGGPLVDRTAPDSPREVRRTNGMLTWTDPEGQDDGAPVARAHWQLCRGWTAPGATAVCAEGSSTDRPFPFSETAVDPGPAPSTCVGWLAVVRLWLEDAAGNVSRENLGGYGFGANPSCVASPPPWDGPLPALAGRRPTTIALAGRAARVPGHPRRRRVTVTATVPRDAAGRVRLRVTRRGSGPRFARTTTATVRGGRAKATFVVPRGVSRLTVRAVFAATATHAAASRTAVLRVG